ncbi:ABC transporter permease [Microbacterium sp. gxy059]|uniref:ABC transporter permease n=1 Tax=Microbacterium sp. gxy059 TaxID=2957199 RepID=UPI003D95655D
MRSWRLLLLSEAKMTIRDYAGLIVPLGLPVLILITSAGMGGEEVLPNGMTVLDVYILPVVLTVVIAMIGIVNMPSFLSGYRRNGVLRQLAVTPISPFRVVGAQVIVSLAQAILGIALAFAVAVLAFGARPPANLTGALAVFGLAVLAMYALGATVAAIAPSQNAAIALGLVLFLGLGAVGGMFGGLASLPEPVAAVGRLLPFGASSEALSAVWSGAPVPLELAVALGFWALVGTAVSLLTFRWDR